MTDNLPPSKNKTLLITGINGYIASVLGLLLLETGYNVRGTVRSKSRATELLEGAYRPYVSRVEIMEVPDITLSGAFNEAVKGVHGIFHMASPLNSKLDSYNDVVIPAQQGTETLLSSGLQAGPQLESVVVTSSTSAVVDIFGKFEPGYIFTEKDSAKLPLDLAVKEKEAGKPSNPFVLYAASKIAAERIVWKFREENKPSFSISTIHPSFVMGPPIVLPRDGQHLNESIKPLYEVFSGTIIPPDVGSATQVDVRDVARIHLWACEHPKIADGERYIVAAGIGPNQAFADLLRERYPDRVNEIPQGTPGKGYVGFVNGKVEYIERPKGENQVSGEKARAAMGQDYITVKQSMLDTAKAFEQYIKNQ